ncbi:Enoyl-CoA hydratase / Delta(3)-cis-delta(2)-trans-enoyl-CoA isomerase / 3-hydroxyacyl-CoA dehydrogenase / 3-hydroxybutyryl-CoA epimerase [hydrothermal vent metagenome]|uniref:Enoyl-CoA hydratase / Delta(3)-cis-delta(2)-trans-enoyl-CoA isomerase / 3-hydroxyacyl-CoA dehydrogenase / 3-hydroxybutyryl-CoA epimerase n=1 Tax=hydrothermal vent metagenome TaxID=652676 RepID=A0A3B0S2K4_9ZZZZ
MSHPVNLEITNSIAVVTINNPPVNALGQAVRAGLLQSIKDAEKDAAVSVILITCQGRTFIAGADIKEFGKPPQKPYLPDLINEIENCSKPVVAALHGTALGGGLEVALGCHYRIAVSAAKMGLPEVLLGILPGAGGTQRLPRLVGAQKALEMITSGAPVKAEQALALGLVDEVADGVSDEDAKAAGLAYASKIIAQNLPVKRTGEQTDMVSASPDLFEKFRKTLAKKARGMIAPFKCVDAVEAAVTLPLQEGLARERQLFEECMASPQREGMIHAFFGERAVGKVKEMATGKAREINKVGIIGGGTMGAGITVALMQSRIPVVMVERDQAAVENGQANVEKILDGGVQRGKLTEDQKAAMLSELYSVSDNYDGLSDVDLVIEAAFEDMDVKKQIFSKLDEVCKPGVILASNTSYLDINEIAATTSRPQDVLGLHFFSPANLMRLLEVVVADKTSDDAVVSGFALAKKMNKVAVRAGVCDGFIGNRILSTYLKCADYMVLDGVSPYDIDKALVAFGYPMGPFAVSDLAGLDIGWATRKRRAATRDPAARYAQFADRICEQGWFGRKTGKGYYIYDENQRPTGPNPAVMEFIEAERTEKKYTDKNIGEEEIIRRYLAAMINEGAKELEEGIAQRPVDIDMVFVFGYGFPRYRGGPMKYADMYGLDKVVADIKEFSASDEKFWQPSQLLLDLAVKNEKFEKLNR